MRLYRAAFRRSVMQDSRMAASIFHTVAIVGAGPVGLTLALDLASRGVSSIILEQRDAHEAPSVKCNHVSSRTMEIFRRLGLAEEIRNAGLPGDYPHDVVVRTRATGFELARIPIPCRKQRFTATEGPDTGWPTPEPAHRINQIYFEPLLFRRAARTPGIEMLNLTRYESHTQHDDGIVITARDLKSQRDVTIECEYLIGCDGGRSDVRRQIGARLQGDDVIQRVQSSYFRAPQLIHMIPRAAWMSYLYTPERAGNLVAIDGKERWLLHNYLLPHEPDFDAVDRDHAIRCLLGVDSRFEYELLSREDWVGRRLVANTFRDRRVFICGDAAHLWVPYAGYGMNAGIADAMNLSWMLAAHLQGWAPATLLDAHETERRPTVEEVSRFVARHAQSAIAERTTLPADIEDDTPAGAASRALVGRAAYGLHVQQFACAGLNYGYCYKDSPLIAYDGEAPPPYTMGDYTPSTVPGCRTPHLWLADGRSLYDAMGNDYTLLRFDSRVDVTGLTEAAAESGVPLTTLDVKARENTAPYCHALLLSRPDFHVAWRGDRVPSDAGALIDLIRGAATTAPV
jgi:2-polyprenyl-6-methoxyphenol hydroxylase-like FAD-dependent oxidoreductase